MKNIYLSPMKTRYLPHNQKIQTPFIFHHHFFIYHDFGFSKCMQGTRARAAMFASDIDLLENTLTVLKSNYVSNISVRPSNPRHKFENIKYQWFLNSHSIIEEVMKEDEDISSNIYNFTPLSDIHKHDSEAKIGKKIYTRIIFLNYHHP